MTWSRRAAVLALAAALAGCHGLARKPAGAAPEAVAESACQGQDPAAAVRAFYALYLANGSSGLPSVAEMADYAPGLSARLVARIDRARAYQQAYQRQFPDDKPPFIEGNLFGSLFEGFSAVEGAAVAAAEPMTVAVDFVYQDRSGQAPVRWRDDALLVCEQGAWRIDDVVYRGGWDFAPSGRLSDGLEVPAQ